MNKSDELIKIAKQMICKGKGILAADESNPTCTKRLESIGIKSTCEFENISFHLNELQNWI